jgi:uncharacterized protein (TIGR02996 family)
MQPDLIRVYPYAHGVGNPGVVWITPTGHRTERGLLNSIRENPTDSLPRLLLADWMEENGSPPAVIEMIRGGALVYEDTPIDDSFTDYGPDEIHGTPYADR